MQKYLGETTWETVDGSSDPAAFVTYLQRLDGSATMQEHRREFLSLLPLQEGERVLDVGCGTGADSMAVSDSVGASGRVVGVDASRLMVQRAAGVARATGGQVGYAAGNASGLPVGSGVFDGLICNRVLMHLRKPAVAVREMARVLKPGGWVALCEPDWSKTRLEPDGRATQAILATHCASFENGAVGSLLGTLVRAAGCEVTTDVERAGVMDDYETAWPMLNLDRSVDAAVDAGVLSPADAARWRLDVEMAGASGAFRMHAVGCFCIGRKVEA